MYKLQRHSILRQYLVILAANLSSLCLGLTISWSSSMLVKLKDGTGSNLPLPITDEEGSWIVSIGVLCAIPVSLASGPLMDKIGRKTCLVVGCIPRVVTCVILLLATEVWMVLLARAIDGVSLGITIPVTATYSSEIASKEIRGALGTIFQSASATGMLISFSIAPFLPYFYVNLMYLCIAIGVCLPIWLLPESPYYLYLKGRKEETIKVLTHLRASEVIAEDEIKQYDVSFNELTEKVNKREIFMDAVTLRTFVTVIFMSILLEMVGYNAVLFYMMPILELTQTTVKNEIGSVVIGCIQLIACLCTMLLTDKLGRKPILTSTLSGMAAGMVGLGTFFYVKEQNGEVVGALNFLPLISLVLVIFSFNAGLGSLYWTVVAELFNSSARAVGVSIGSTTASVFVFLTTKYFMTVINHLGGAFTFWIYSIICIVAALFIMVFVPETKDKTFAEIQMELRKIIKARI